jgi:DNA-directed RNA polymerase subunit RPC12/RpoP
VRHVPLVGPTSTRTEFQYWSHRFVGATGNNLLGDLLHRLQESKGINGARASCPQVFMADVAEKLQIDIERRTTRGRVCPVCGGKIIPARRAVYESKADPDAVFPLWQCERCGYEELSQKPDKPAKKH